MPRAWHHVKASAGVSSVKVFFVIIYEVSRSQGELAFLTNQIIFKVAVGRCVFKNLILTGQTKDASQEKPTLSLLAGEDLDSNLDNHVQSADKTPLRFSSLRYQVG